MAGTVRTLLLLTLTFSFFCTCGLLPAQSGMHAAVRDYVLPQYRGNEEDLQFVIFGDEAMNKGALVHLKKVKIDMVMDDVDSLENANIYIPSKTERIPEAYPIQSPAEDVIKFWFMPKNKTVRAWIYADTGVYDKSTRILRSPDHAHFRSREMDVDGVGFDAYTEKKLIHIRSKVRVVLRITAPGAMEKLTENKPNQEKKQ